MTAKLWEVGTSNCFSTTLNGTITSDSATIALTSVSGLQYPGLIVVDRQDSNNVDTPTVREFISYTGISGSSLTGCTRGLGGSTAQAHNSGAKVEEVLTTTHWGDLVDFLQAEHSATGTHSSLVTLTGVETLTNKTLTSPVLTTPQINDTSLDHQYIFAGSELTADRTVTLPLLTGNDDFVFEDHTQTLTNKRVTKRITTITSHATPTVNTDNCDCVTITALAEAITSMTTNLSGTPTNFQTLIYRIKDNGTTRNITWGTSFANLGGTMPTATTAGKVHTVGFIYNTVTSKWECVAAVVEA